MAFTQIPKEAIRRMTELSAGALRLYLFLADCRNTTTGKCCPSVAVTAEAIGVHKRNIFKLRNELAEAGWAHFDGDNVTDLLGTNSGKKTTKNVESIEDIPITEETGKNATIYTVSTGKNTSGTGKNATNHWQKRHQKVAKMPVACKEEQYEGTRLIEQDELIPVATAPAGIGKDECYALFVKLRTTVGEYEAPYQNQTADFVHLAKLFKNCERTNWPLTREKFTQAATHYFATPQKVHTLADLATRFSEFYKSAFDKFGKPIRNGNGKLDSFTPNARQTIVALESFVKRNMEKGD